MKIYLSSQTAGRGGGASLKGLLTHLDGLIQTTFDEQEFESSFDEFWLNLAYPPMYVLPGVVGMEKQFLEYYEKYPISRLNRRYKSIDITLKAPEFSEHFDKKSSENYEHTFRIDPNFQDIDELDLAEILIQKYIEAGDLIKKKLKKGDVFDLDHFNEILLSIKGKLSEEFLSSSNEQEKQSIHDEALRRALNLRDERKSNRKDKDKLLRDLRLYYNGLPNKALYPYDYQYLEIFRNLLIRKEFKCPTYHHIYIQTAESEEDALNNTFALEDWYSNCISLIDYQKYADGTEDEKSEMVFELISNGLKDITELDGLDENILRDTIEKIKSQKLDTELTFRTLENKKYELRITYLSRSMEEECPIFFNVREKETGKENKVQIGKADNSQIYLWLQKVTITNKLVRVKSSNSVRGEVWLKDKPRTMEFTWGELLN